MKSYAHVTTAIPGPKSKAMLEEWNKFEADKTGFQAQVAIHHGKGALLFDEDGNCFIDWTSGVLVTNVGHCHPKLVKAIQECASNILNVYEYANRYRTDAARQLVKVAPAHLNKIFFLSTGSEATDSAIRIMKRATGKFEILSFFGGFHGRTMSTASVGGLAKTKKAFGPTTPGVIRAPFPYCYRCAFKSKPDSCGLMCLDFIEDTIRANSVDSLAGAIIEPYLGTAGFIFPPKGYLPMLEKLIREKNMLFTLDEVQSCFGRTGKMWACEHEGLTPDIITAGKGIGSGISVSALLMKGEVVDQALGKGELGSTYGGNPLSCAAVSSVIDIMRSDNIVENVQKIEPIFKKRLMEMKDMAPNLGDVRGLGLVWGMEIVDDKQSKIPSPKLAKKLVDICAECGLLIGIVGIFGNVIRVAPPLVINEEQAHESLDIMEKAIMRL